MTRNQFILLKMAEAYSIGNSNLVNTYIYEEDTLTDAQFSSSNYGLAIIDNSFLINNIKERTNDFYLELVNKYFNSDKNILLNLKNILNLINNENDIEALNKLLYKFIILIIRLLNYDNLNIKPNDSFNSRLIQTAMGYTDNSVLISNNEIITDKLYSFFNIIKSHNKEAIEAYMNELNDIILNNISFI